MSPNVIAAARTPAEGDGAPSKPPDPDPRTPPGRRWTERCPQTADLSSPGRVSRHSFSHLATLGVHRFLLRVAMVTGCEVCGGGVCVTDLALNKARWSREGAPLPVK